MGVGEQGPIQLTISRAPTVSTVLFCAVTVLLSISCSFSYSFSTVAGTYGSKQAESEGVARGRDLFTIAINP